MQQAIQRSHQHADIQSQEVCFVETAVQGVAEADREEIAALAACYGPQRPQPLALGTLTSQIGHTGGTAGMAGTVEDCGCPGTDERTGQSFFGPGVLGCSY